MKTTILFGGTLAALLAAGTSRAQTHKVTSPDTVVRAVGVYEWTGDLTKPTGSRLVPVTVFIDGQLQDAGVYLPRPVPFALVSGNVYELEDAGLAKGLVELESAVKTTLPDGAPGPAFDEGWTGYGSYKPPAAQHRSTAATLKPSKNLPVITSSKNDSDRPHFSNGSGDTNKPASSTGANSPTDTSKKTDTSSTTEDTDRPTMKRRDTSDASTDGASSQTPSTTSSDDEADRPTLKRRSPEDEKAAAKERKKNDVATVTAAGSLNDDPDRPTLHHGNAGEGSSADMPKLLGIPKDLHQMVAVSDAKNRAPHPFARPWESTDERATVLAKMQAFARAKLADYGIVPGITPPSAIASTGTVPTTTITPSANTDGGPPTLKRGVPTAAKTAPEPTAPATKTPTASAKPSSTSTAKGRRAPAKGPAPVTLANEELKGYLLSYGGAPTYVYMAHTVEHDSVMRYVTVVAQADAMGEVKVAMASVTDAAHLDRTPWMRLIDAVDVEASNRASLLFELRGQSSRQFALYRVIATKPEQIFATGSPL
ncbi:hypothetical protein [Edaphobacter aggregans]|uniref:hypothetical protein n=1 Tax=Edaphobacter aggregans TaxID=570835 RepID=UPI00054D99DC|nr:hypothetical protein [Edaphobacter aggregans]